MTNQMYPIDRGFIKQCNARGITNPKQIQQLMKIGYDLLKSNPFIMKKAEGIDMYGGGADIGGMMGGMMPNINSFNDWLALAEQNPEQAAQIIQSLPPNIQQEINQYLSQF